MKSYSEREIFTEAEVKLFHRATQLVGMLNNPIIDTIRCHELARAVGLLLDLPHEDGFYGFVDHTWLWTRAFDSSKCLTARIGFPHILDVYSVGSLPMVRLVDCVHTSLPHLGWGYRPNKERTDIDMSIVHDLVNLMKRSY